MAFGGSTRQFFYFTLAGMAMSTMRVTTGSADLNVRIIHERLKAMLERPAPFSGDAARVTSWRRRFDSTVSVALEPRADDADLPVPRDFA